MVKALPRPNAKAQSPLIIGKTFPAKGALLKCRKTPKIGH